MQHFNRYPNGNYDIKYHAAIYISFRSDMVIGK